MNRFSIVVFVSSLMLFSVPTLAADRPTDMKATEISQSDALKAEKKKVGKLEKRLCCKTASGNACYVFGNASCTNCASFCNGDMVIEPAEPATR